MRRNRHNKDGWLLVEAVVSLAVLVTLLGALALAAQGYRRLNRCQWLRVQAVAACMAQLDSMATTGRPIAPAETQRLWPNLTVTTQKDSGRGTWQGLDLLTVQARGRNEPRTAVTLSRYVTPRETLP